MWPRTLATLRALPNFKVYRPADAVETAECWALALQDDAGPSGIVLSRQGLPTLRRAHTTDNVCARGAYVLADVPGGHPDLNIELRIESRVMRPVSIPGIVSCVEDADCPGTQICQQDFKCQ